MSVSTNSTAANLLLLTGLGLAALLPTPTAAAQAPSAPSAPWLDIEVDPLAFAANGYSVHGGVRVGHLRVDVGAFGMAVPDFLLGSDDFDVRFGGFGVKLDYHFNQDVGGPFFGIAASRASNAVVHSATDAHTEQFVHELSVRVGYEFDLLAGIYVAPWISVGHMFGSDAVTVAGDTLDGQPAVTLFPTVHVGYRL